MVLSDGTSCFKCLLTSRYKLCVALRFRERKYLKLVKTRHCNTTAWLLLLTNKSVYTLGCLMQGRGRLLIFKTFLHLPALITTPLFINFGKTVSKAQYDFSTKFCFKDKNSLQCTRKLIGMFSFRKGSHCSVLAQFTPTNCSVLVFTNFWTPCLSMLWKTPTPCLLRPSLVLGTREYISLLRSSQLICHISKLCGA